ncbi:MAG TPA: ATP-binding protein [Gemmatimonadaceae bacterium]|nr:ATP-binding protein [Gemmatimonadaceae bacterium]
MPQSAFALERSIPSDVQYIEGIVAEVAAGCATFDFPSHLMSLNVPVALTEALANAILRGNGDDREKTVRIRVRVDDVQLVVEVVDEGKGFDLAACTRDPTTPDRLELEDGRGLFLMQRLVDRLEQYVDGGNVVRFTVRRT